MPARTITQAYFSFTDAKGRMVVAERGDTVDVPEGPELERGEAGGAWALESLPQESPGAVPAAVATTTTDGSPIMGDDLEIVLKGNVKAVLAYAEENPHARDELIAREIGGENRKGVVAGLQKIVVPELTPVTPPEIAPVPVDIASAVDGDEEAVLVYATAHPDELQALLDAEEKGKNRQPVMEGLLKLQEAASQD